MKEGENPTWGEPPKPIAPEIYNVLQEVWIEFYGYPLDLSVEAAKLQNEIGEEHRHRISYFEKYIREQNARLGDTPTSSSDQDL